jgi:hypothetical protein
LYVEAPRERHANVPKIQRRQAFGPTSGGVHGTVELIDPDR